MTATVLHGDCIDVLATLPAESVDAVVTDPPAGIAFMNKAWDRDKGGRDAWVAWMAEVAAECLRVAKPGAHALVWALPRTSHWTATAWENAGWDVRDRVAHLFGTGFPKSMAIDKAIDKAAGAEREVVGVAGRSGSSRACMAGDFAGGDYFATIPATDAARQWQGWGTALKPAMEDWWLLRKPLACPTVAAQVLATGTGALNIDGCRIPADWANDPSKRGFGYGYNREGYEVERDVPVSAEVRTAWAPTQGRWPANLAHDGSDEVLEAFAAFDGGRREGWYSGEAKRGIGYGSGVKSEADGSKKAKGTGDTGTAARFFYSAKASKLDRCDSRHPTIKPLALMSWLCKLVCPPGGTVLDPFAGSGSTGEAALREGFDCILIEREAEYIADIHRRLARHVAAAPLLAEAA